MIPVWIRPTHQSSLCVHDTATKSVFSGYVHRLPVYQHNFHQRYPATKHAIADNKPNTFQLNLAHVSQPTFFFYTNIYFDCTLFIPNLPTRNLRKKKFTSIIFKQQADLWNLFPAHPFYPIYLAHQPFWLWRLFNKIYQQQLFTNVSHGNLNKKKLAQKRFSQRYFKPGTFLILKFIVRLNFLVAVCIKSKRERGTPRVSTPLRILKSKLKKKKKRKEYVFLFICFSNFDCWFEFRCKDDFFITCNFNRWIGKTIFQTLFQ